MRPLKGEEIDHIDEIARRAAGIMVNYELIKESARPFAERATYYELMICHTEIVPLRLKEMRMSERNADLIHDVIGIHNHLEFNHSTGRHQLNDGFLPRYANTES